MRNRRLALLPTGCWKTNTPWGCEVMDLVSDSPSFPQHGCHSCHGKVAPGLLSAHSVVPAQEDFSCLGKLGVYGKRVGRSEGKMATVWLGGRDLFWLGAGHGAAGVSG